MRTLLLFLATLSFWLLLSGKYYNPQLWILAIISCGLSTAICVRMRIVDDESQPVRGLLSWFAYLSWLMLQIAKANVDVARVVWSPKLSIDPQMIELDHDLRTSLGRVTYANSITLTPGTVTVEMGRRRVLVHALTQAGADDLITGEMLKRIRAREVEPTR